MNLNGFIIVIEDLPDSVSSAERCFNSNKTKHLSLNYFKAITPKDNPLSILKEEKIKTDRFSSSFSQLEPSYSCFLSHYYLWKKCVEINEPIVILEHDAFFVHSLNFTRIDNNDCVNLGRPSYGDFFEQRPGIHPLFSKEHFPGTHGYLIGPDAANNFIEYAQKRGARNIDLFLNKYSFPFLKEIYPWPIIANDTFSTIQKIDGCRSKHNFNKKYKIYEL